MKRVLRKDKVALQHQRTSQPIPRFGDYKKQLETWLIEEKNLPKSQRCTGKKLLYKRLKNEGYKGGL